MKELAEMTGWITVYGVVFAMLDYILKYINKKYLVKISKNSKKVIKAYRLVMKYGIRYHKPVGIITILAAIAHFVLMLTFAGISITGIVAMVIMFSIILLGLYGAFVNRKYNGKWLLVHRFLAFVLIIAIGIHLL